MPPLPPATARWAAVHYVTHSLTRSKHTQPAVSAPTLLGCSDSYTTSTRPSHDWTKSCLALLLVARAQSRCRQQAREQAEQQGRQLASAVLCCTHPCGHPTTHEHICRLACRKRCSFQQLFSCTQHTAPIQDENVRASMALRLEGCTAHGTNERLDTPHAPSCSGHFPYSLRKWNASQPNTV